MSTNHKRSLLLSPILLSMLTAGAAHAQDVQGNEAHSSPVSVNTAITRADVEFNAQAQQFMETAKKDKVATQCSHYSVDSKGNAHCAFYDSQTAPIGNNVVMAEFDV